MVEAADGQVHVIDEVKVLGHGEGADGSEVGARGLGRSARAVAEGVVGHILGAGGVGSDAVVAGIHVGGPLFSACRILVGRAVGEILWYDSRKGSSRPGLLAAVVHKRAEVVVAEHRGHFLVARCVGLAGVGEGVADVGAV